MEEYLQWLDNKIRGANRKVLLLLDNFSGHELGVELVGGKQGLSNVRVEWLPPNTTSHWQPLDQGIIASFKTIYCKEWILYMLRQYEDNKDLNKTVNLLKAIQWTRKAWDQVTKTTIQRCWWRSTIIKKPIDQDPVHQQDQDLQAQTTDLQTQITRLPNITNPLSANEFIQINGEAIEDELEDGDEEQVFQDIVDQYRAGNEDILDPGEDAAVEEEDREISLIEAIQALETLRLYTLQREDGSETLLRELDQTDQQFQAVLVNQRKQKSIKSYFQ
jgi:hypothetical protein